MMSLHPAESSSCEICGRKIISEAEACPRRQQGQCAYRQQNLVSWVEHFKGIGLILLAAILLFVVWTKSPGFLGYLGGLLVIIPFAFAGLYLLRREVFLYNEATGVRWKRQSFLGYELGQTLFLPADPVTIDFKSSESIDFPASVIELTVKSKILGKESAVAIFRAALIDLMARDCVKANQYKKYNSGWRKKEWNADDVFVLKATGQSACEKSGALEQRIISILTSWPEKGSTIEWPDEAPIYELVRAVYGKDVDSPADWLFNLVTKDAVAQGWGEYKRKRTFSNEFIPDSVLPARQGPFVRELSAKLEQDQPALSKALDKEIEQAIISRKKEVNDSYQGA